MSDFTLDGVDLREEAAKAIAPEIGFWDADGPIPWEELQDDNDGYLSTAAYCRTAAEAALTAARVPELLAVVEAARETVWAMRALVPAPGPKPSLSQYQELPVALRGVQHLDSLEKALDALDANLHAATKGEKP